MTLLLTVPYEQLTGVQQEVPRTYSNHIAPKMLRSSCAHYVSETQYTAASILFYDHTLVLTL